MDPADTSAELVFTFRLPPPPSPDMQEVAPNPNGGNAKRCLSSLAPCPSFSRNIALSTPELALAVLRKLEDVDDLLHAGMCCRLWRSLSEVGALQLWCRLSRRRWRDMRNGLDCVTDYKVCKALLSQQSSDGFGTP